MLPPRPKVALIGYVIPAPLFVFQAARKRYWAEKFGLQVVDSVDSPNDQVAAAQQIAAGLLARHSDLDGILGFLDEPAIGAALAARAAGRRDVKTFGITAGSLGRTAIRNGRLTASVFVDPIDLGRKMAQAAYAAAEGIKTPRTVLSGRPYIVTKANVG